MPSIPAISSCRYPSTSCRTKTCRDPSGSRSIAAPKSTPCSGRPTACRHHFDRFLALVPASPAPAEGAAAPENHVDCQPVEPGSEGRFAPEGAQLVPGPDEDVLHRVVRLVRVQHPAGEGVHPAPVPPVQALEGSRIPTGGKQGVGRIRGGRGGIARNRQDLVPRVRVALRRLGQAGGLEGCSGELRGERGTLKGFLAPKALGRGQRGRGAEPTRRWPCPSSGRGPNSGRDLFEQVT